MSRTGRVAAGAVTVAAVSLVAAVVAAASPTTTAPPTTERAAVGVYVVLPPDCSEGPAVVTVENGRAGPVEVRVDGVLLGSVAAGTSARFVVDAYEGVEITEAAEPVPFEEAVVCADEAPDPVRPAERPVPEPGGSAGPVAGADAGPVAGAPGFTG